jgi:hypothetical protein
MRTPPMRCGVSLRSQGDYASNSGTAPRLHNRNCPLNEAKGATGRDGRFPVLYGKFDVQSTQLTLSASYVVPERVFDGGGKESLWATAW